MERIANTEPVSIDVPGVADVSKASANKARQLGVGIVNKFAMIFTFHEGTLGLGSAPRYELIAGLDTGMVSISAGDTQTAAAGTTRA